MGEPHILTTLRRKRAQIEAVIAAYEAKIEAAKIDLAAVDRSLRLFDPGERGQTAPYFELGRLWKHGEIVAVCRWALEREGPLDTAQLAEHVSAAKGLDGQDAVMINAVTARVARALSNGRRRGRVGELPRRNGVRVWSVT